MLFQPIHYWLSSFKTRNPILNFIDYSGFFNSAELTALITLRDKNYALKNNRDNFIESLKFDTRKIIFPHQTHSCNISIVDKSNSYPETDGLISTTKNLGIGILIADCTPVFLFGVNSGHCAIIHSGWKGAAGKITTNALKKFIPLGNKPYEIKAVIGPSIDKCCFEVGPDVARNFSSNYLFSKKGSKLYLDIKSEIYEELMNVGLSKKNIYRDRYCTFCEEEKFFSYRREGALAGRMVAIMNVKSR